MAKNKITYEVDSRDGVRQDHIFIGSQRQPTIMEAIDYMRTKDIDVCDHLVAVVTQMQYECFGEWDNNKTLVLIEDDYTRSQKYCLLCSRHTAKDYEGDRCPICGKDWSSDA